MTGRISRPHACSYYLDGAAWAFTIEAESTEDARRRIAAIGSSGRVDGVLVLTLPGWVPLPVVEAAMWIIAKVKGNTP